MDNIKKSHIENFLTVKLEGREKEFLTDILPSENLVKLFQIENKLNTYLDIKRLIFFIFYETKVIYFHNKYLMILIFNCCSTTNKT